MAQEEKAVEQYLQKYIGLIVKLPEEEIHLNKDFVDEYANSIYTRGLRGGIAKAKANAAQGIKEMLKVAVRKGKMENKERKHRNDAKYGWMYYTTRFAIPIYNEVTNTITYNIYKAQLIVKHSKDGNLYLHDMQRIKKETSNPLLT